MISHCETQSANGLDGLDDARAHEALQQWHAPYDSVADWTQRACLRCKQIGIIVGDGLCAGCHADRQWTLVNRALCDLVHRGTPGHRNDGSRFGSAMTDLVASTAREAA